MHGISGNDLCVYKIFRSSMGLLHKSSLWLLLGFWHKNSMHSRLEIRSVNINLHNLHKFEVRHELSFDSNLSDWLLLRFYDLHSVHNWLHLQ